MTYISTFTDVISVSIQHSEALFEPEHPSIYALTLAVGQSPPGQYSQGHLGVTITAPPDLGRNSLLIRQLCVQRS